MPRQPLYEATTERIEILDADGNVDRALMPDLDPERIREVYSSMVLMRAFDDKAIRLQRQGRMGTWASIAGQEAAQAGVGLAMDEEDWLVPAFREHGLMLMRGIPGHLLYAYWAGDERGSAYAPETRCLPIAVPVGSQHQHGAGLGLAFRLRSEPHVAVTYGGDGSTSEGDFHEAVNFAAVFKAQTVFVIQNNQWAISIPYAQQTASETIAQKAHAYGIPGIQVDGNDIFAVYVATMEALERARAGGGPTLIEALTYRLGDHTTADEASRYRSPDEVERWRAKDPIVRLRKYLTGEGLWDDEQEGVLLEQVQERVDADVAAYEGMPPADPSEMFSSMYADLPPHVREQMEELRQELGS